jgi:hypothetical protein
VEMVVGSTVNAVQNKRLLAGILVRN